MFPLQEVNAAPQKTVRLTNFINDLKAIRHGIPKPLLCLIRKVWEHEARDFSGWLVKDENLALLSEELGIEIEAVGTEQSSGRFKIDILAKETNSGDYIIIENQLEPTNHDHLGKVITYAAGYDAKYIIWIVKDVLDEHQKAIEWLNEHLDDSISCFLIKIEVWQIGESKTNETSTLTSLTNQTLDQHGNQYRRLQADTPKPRHQTCASYQILTKR